MGFRATLCMNVCVYVCVLNTLVWFCVCMYLTMVLCVCVYIHKSVCACLRVFVQ